MPQNPMLQPDSRGTPPSWEEKSSGEKSPGEKSEEKKSAEKRFSGRVGDVISSSDPRDVAEVARALAAHGGGAASFDLALDLVLHQVVEEARFVTGATGAAIALARAGEMVCRATSGPDAPDLGVRLETASGLSGACLQTGTVQQCGDTETDPRVNAEACRRLGVRSILVLPLRDGREPFGLLEVFSPLADAFGERDKGALQILARRVVENKRGAKAVAGAVPSAVLASTEEMPVLPAIELKNSPELTTSPGAEQISESAAESLANEGYRRSSNIWTPVLGMLVIVTAVLLGLAMGWRGAIVRGLHGGLNSGGNGRSKTASSTSQAATANRGGDSVLAPGTADGASGGLAAPTQGGSASQVPSSPGSPPRLAGPPSGGLVVTQNGKVIYRLSEVEAAGASGSEASPEGAGSDSRLIYRVEPQYPAEARTQKIQGVVTLEVQIGSEGAVHNIAVVDGNPMLAEAAVQAVRQWRYLPYEVDGRPVEMQTRIRIRFTLPPR